MILSELEIHQFGIIHQKTDTFSRVFEPEKEDGTPFMPEGFDPVWEIYENSEITLTMENSDFLISGTELIIEKPASFFAELSKLADYTHRFYDRATQNTFFEGPFKLT